LNRVRSLTIGRGALDAIVRHARETAPAECCGLLVGEADRIVEAIRSANLAESPHRFLIDPKTHIDAIRSARDRGQEVLGFYHSHPRTPARPSETDIEEAAYRDHVHLIVSLLQERPDIRLYRIDASAFEELRLITA
jgi:proteasome lid subunit RPN8/RPN11